MEIGEEVYNKINPQFSGQMWGLIDIAVTSNIINLVTEFLTEPIRQGIVVGVVLETRKLSPYGDR